MITGFESATCGALSYAMTSLQTWIVQDLTDDRTFSIDVDEDASLIGVHTLIVEVSSIDYPFHIGTYTISVPITV